MKIDFSKTTDGLVPVIVQEYNTLKVLMLGYMNQAAYEKTQKEINALMQKYSQETLKHLHKLKHDACYNEMLNLINFSKIRKK